MSERGEACAAISGKGRVPPRGQGVRRPVWERGGGFSARCSLLGLAGGAPLLAGPRRLSPPRTPAPQSTAAPRGPALPHTSMAAWVATVAGMGHAAGRQPRERASGPGGVPCSKMAAGGFGVSGGEG